MDWKIILLVVLVFFLLYKPPENFQPALSIDNVPIYFIVMPNNDERLKNVKLQIEKHKLTKAKIFPGVDGKNIDLDVCLSRKITSPHQRQKVGRGQVGAALAHLKLWEYEKAKYFIVLEDDVILGPNFKNDLHDFLSELPDDFDYAYLYHRPDKKDLRKQLKSKIAIPGKKFVTKGYSTWGTVGYVISQKGINTIKPHVLPLKWPIDNVIWRDLFDKGRLVVYMPSKEFVNIRSELPSQAWIF